MIIRIFKISTMEMWTLPNKKELINFIESETGVLVSDKFSIKTLLKYLPIEDYCHIK